MRNSHPLLNDLLPYLIQGTPAASGAILARILLSLADHEIAEGGPYAWLPGGNAQDVDPGFNIVVALFLRTLDVNLPQLDSSIESACAHGLQSIFFDPSELATLIARFNGTLHPEAPMEAGSAAKWTDEELRILTHIRQRLDWRLMTLPKQFADAARGIVDKTIMGNPDKQMSLLPLFIRQAFGERGRIFTDDQLAEFGLANIFFWTAFIIYDDFWDEDEAAQPRLLPVANLFARHYTRFFSTKCVRKGLDTIFHELMDKLDAANEWEVAVCSLKREGSTYLIPPELPRYDDFHIKFYPAAGQVLGPVAMLLALGYGKRSPEVENLISYFQQYLIAMQLNDDAHDWKEDLERGRISTAVFFLLEAWRDAHPERTFLELEKDMPELERLFWFETLPRMCASILSHTERAQKALDSLSFIQDPSPLQQFIDRNRVAAEQALAEQRESIAFLEAMKGTYKTQK